MPGTHRSLHAVYREEIRPGSNYWLLAYPRDVHAELRSRIPVPATFRRRNAQLLRLVRRLPARLAGDMGRENGRRRKRRLVQQQVHRGHGKQSEHDPHAGCALRHRGAAQWRQTGGPLAGFQPGFQASRLVGPDKRRHGWGTVDGRESRHSQRISRGPAGAVFHRLSQALFRHSILNRDRKDGRWPRAGEIPSGKPPGPLSRRGKGRLEVPDL